MTDQHDVVELLADHEHAIAELYTAFAQVFPGHRALWQSIAREEVGHSDALLRLRSGRPVETAEAYAQFRPQAVLTSIAFVEEKAQLARTGALSALQALAVGRDVESALLEGAFFKAAKMARPALKPILDELAAESREHLRLITDALDEERSASSR